MKLEWRKLRQWPAYEASDAGHIRRLKTGHILKGCGASAGYLTVNMPSTGPRGQQSAYIHRLVANTFLGDCPPGLQVNHKNGVKTDNRLENLEYVTPQTNTLHAITTGFKKVGANDPKARLSEAEVLAIAKMRGEKSCRDIAEIYGVTSGAVSGILTGRSWWRLTGIPRRAPKEPKLTPSKVNAIINLLHCGTPQRSIAKQFGVTQATIWSIASGRSWSWVKQ